MNIKVADPNSRSTVFEKYKSEMAFIIKNDKLARHFSIYTFSDMIKAHFEQYEGRIKIFQKMTFFKTNMVISNLHAVS